MNALATMFEGSPVTFVPFRGAPVVVARELGAALGYADPGRLPEMVRAEWADDFVDGEDYHLLTGPALAEFKAGDSPRMAGVVAGRASSLLVLTESGWWAVALRTEKAMGVRLRRFLKTEVLPKLARGESVGATPRVGSEVRRARELRLLAAPFKRTDPSRHAAMLDEAAFAEWGGEESPVMFGKALRQLGYKPRASNQRSRAWVGLTLTDDPNEAAVLAWAQGREFSLNQLREATSIDHDNRTLATMLRRAGYTSVRARAEYRYFDKWRKLP